MQIATTHLNTDFDALASVIAATLIYPGAAPILPKNLNPNVKAFLSIHKDLLPVSTVNDINLEEVTSLIVVDVNNLERLDRMTPLKDKDDLEIHLWDHHANGGDIAASFSCQEPVGSTVTLLTRQLKKNGCLLTPIQATLLLAGIYEDTGNLTFSSTTAEDLYAAGYLLECKADLKIVNTFLRPAYGEKQKNILFEMLQNAERAQINGHAISINKLNVTGYVDSLAVVVRMYMEIVNVDVAFGIFFDSQRDHCMVIGRSTVDSFDVGAVMRSMGGGGHPNAGAALLKSVTPAAAEAWINELIRGHRRSSAQISDIMSFPVVTVTEDTPMKKVAQILKEKGCTGVPVVRGSAPVGIVSRRDFRRIKKESQLDSPVKAYMTTRVLSIGPGTSPMQAAQLMVKHDIGRLPVVEDNRIIGIVTRSDAMLYFYDLLPD